MLSRSAISSNGYRAAAELSSSRTSPPLRIDCFRLAGSSSSNSAFDSFKSTVDWSIDASTRRATCGRDWTAVLCDSFARSVSGV